MSAPIGQPQTWQPTPTGANNNQYQSLFQSQPSMGGKGGSTMNTQFKPNQMTTVQAQQDAIAKAQANTNASPLSLQYGMAGPYYGAYTGGGSS